MNFGSLPVVQTCVEMGRDGGGILKEVRLPTVLVVFVDPFELLNIVVVVFVAGSDGRLYDVCPLLRSAQPRNTEEQCKQIFEKGTKIEQEFAEYFTGEGAV